MVEGRITRLTNFGAFARLLIDDVDGDLEGLIHISEISERRIEHPKELLHEGDVVTLRIIKIEEDTHRIGLSMRRVDSPAYTDLDWKTLTEEFDVDGMTDAAPVEEAAEEAEVDAEVEAAADDVAEAVAEETVEAEEAAEEAAEEKVEAEEAVEEAAEEVSEEVAEEAAEPEKDAE